MGLWDRISGREERVSPSNSQAWGNFFKGWNMPDSSGVSVSVETALQVPAVWAAVNFLSSAMASMPLQVFKRIEGGQEQVKGGLATLLGEAVNDEWSSEAWRHYSFWQTFTGGRQFTWIERGANGQIANLWPLDPDCVTVERKDGRKSYRYKDAGRDVVYAAADVIDLPFALQPNQLDHYSPIDKGRDAIGLAVSMGKYASGFFAGGGVPPLALYGPLPAGAEAIARQQGDVNRAIESARAAKKPIFSMPPGHELKPVGFEPEKGQMNDARGFQIEEIARLYGMPPWFLQVLTHANFANSENQDLHLVKHTLTHWCERMEGELNLKLFGRRNSSRFVKFNMDGVMRGDFKSRIEGIVRGVQGALFKPNEGRAWFELPPEEGGDKLYIQGATVPLGTQPVNQPPSTDNGAPDEPTA